MKRPLRIVHTEASCGWGGQEIRILSEAQGMIGRGHLVTLVCPQESRIFQEAPRWQVAAEALPIARKRPAAILAMRRWLASHPCDVVNSHSSTDTWLVALAARLLRRPPPLVRTRHISAPLSGNRSTRWLYRDASQHIVTTGEALRGEVMRILHVPAQRVSSVPTGADTTRFVPGERAAARVALGLPPQRNYIGIVATLRSWKGHLFLLDAFARLAAPDWDLLIVGEGPMRNVIEPRIAQLGLAGRVRLVGQQDKPEAWLRSLDIFCLPSYANEGVPQAIVQAMLTALPIVTTPVGAILEAVAAERSALVVPPQDAAALAQALQRLMADAALCAALGQAARTDALARFSREAMIDAMEAVFERVVLEGEARP